MWVTKSYDDKFQQEYKIERKLLEVKGTNHVLELFNSEAFGEIALIDQKTLLLKNLLCVQSELLAHLSACSHKNPKRVLIVGSFNLELAFEFLRHDTIQVDFLQFDLKILESLISFLPHYKEVMESERFQLIPRLNEEFLEKNSQENSIKYDVVISLGSDTESFTKLLSDDGILIVKAPQILLDTLSVKIQLESLGDFAVKMPFYAPLSVMQDCYIFASKLYHPTADLQLQRADMLEGLKYYHANFHLSAFVLPKALRLALLGVAKN